MRREGVSKSSSNQAPYEKIEIQLRDRKERSFIESTQIEKQIWWYNQVWIRFSDFLLVRFALRVKILLVM